MDSKNIVVPIVIAISFHRDRSVYLIGLFIARNQISAMSKDL
ncbi:MAG: hypothetical protein ACI9L9_001670, partial [Marivirga sp.]